MAMLYDDKTARAFDAETGISVSYGGRDHSFWELNDIELVTISGQGYVVRYSVKCSQVTQTLRWLSNGPSPTEFVEHPPGQDARANWDWLNANWEPIEAGILLVFARGEDRTYEVKAKW